MIIALSIWKNYLKKNKATNNRHGNDIQCIYILWNSIQNEKCKVYILCKLLPNKCKWICCNVIHTIKVIVTNNRNVRELYYENRYKKCTLINM